MLKPGFMQGVTVPLFPEFLGWPLPFPGGVLSFGTVATLCTVDFGGESASAGIASVRATVRIASLLSMVRILRSSF
jgi:hypothetical protein